MEFIRVLFRSSMKNIPASSGSVSYQQALRANIDHEEQLALARGEGYNRAAAMQRKFGLLEDVPFDDGGRFFISPFLKKLCSIDDIVFINGSGDYFEL